MSPGRIADRNGLNIGGTSVPYGMLLLIAGGSKRQAACKTDCRDRQKKTSKKVLTKGFG